ncbi:putative phosphorylated adapter RNA export protein, RNA-binding domain-containing protein [Tanacetum coccineum]
MSLLRLVHSGKGKLKGKQSISLEPGGQFELSGAPLETLHQTCAMLIHIFTSFFVFIEGEYCLLDSIFDVDNVEDMDDVDMVDVEEGELARENHRRELGQNSSVDGDLVPQQSQSISLLFYNHSFDEGRSVDVQFVLDTCRHLKEKKSYLVWTAVGCLGVPCSE